MVCRACIVKLLLRTSGILRIEVGHVDKARLSVTANLSSHLRLSGQFSVRSPSGADSRGGTSP